MKAVWGGWKSGKLQYYVDKNRYYHKALVYISSSTNPVSGPIFGHVFKTVKLDRVKELYKQNLHKRPGTNPVFVEDKTYLIRLV